MEVEFTARQVKISKALRTQAEEGMERIARILGKTAPRKRHLRRTKARPDRRDHGPGPHPEFAAYRQGRHPRCRPENRLIDHALNQARRYRDKRLESKRLPKEEKILTAPPVARPKARTAQPAADGAGEVHRRFQRPAPPSPSTRSPTRPTVVEPHILKRRSHLPQAHDHRRGSQRHRVPRPRSAHLPQPRREICSSSTAAATGRWNWWRFPSRSGPPASAPACSKGRGLLRVLAP